MKQIIVVWLIALSFLITYQTMAQSGQLYMRLPATNFRGYDYDCVSTYPYETLRPMAWNETEGFTEIENNFELIERVVAVADCNVDLVFRDEDSGELFMWRMTDVVCERNFCAIHPNRGAFWVRAN